MYATFPEAFRAVAKGKGHEEGDLRRLIDLYKAWARRLLPALPFDQFVESCERLGSSRRMQGALHTMRQREVNGVRAEEWGGDEGRAAGAGGVEQGQAEGAAGGEGGEEAEPEGRVFGWGADADVAAPRPPPPAAATANPATEEERLIALDNDGDDDDDDFMDMMGA